MVGGYPGQVLMVGGVPRPGLDGGGVPRVPPQPGLDGGGVPPHHDWMGYPPHHSEHWLRGGRYASCVHAGGLSCFVCFHEVFIFFMH